ncbi:MAG: hypothetical protein IPL65_01735 [Lewinellaceae bacterium]|nr:hypothetical protein [Lewinellaceae bacterium]
MLPSTRFLFFLTFLTALAACNTDTGRKAPDVSGIPGALNIRRFDQDMFSVDTTHLKAGLEQLMQKYPDFLPFFLQEVAHDASNPKETPQEAFDGFVTAPMVRRLADSCALAFKDLQPIEKDLSQMMRYYRYYFPKMPAPGIVTAVTEFVGDAYMVNDSLMMIGLDMFLGEEFSGYNPDIFPMYLRRQFEPEYLPTKAAMALSSQVAGPPNGDRILDYMIHNGKILYIMAQLLPATPDSLLMGYTQADMEACYANEQNTWARLLNLKVLYEPLGAKNQKIVMPSPRAENVFTEAPGEIGNWIGWQIVNAYMERHPGTSMEELLAFSDAQKFMEAAKYKPKR